MTDLVVERRGSGPPILFIHGATLDHRAWRPQVDALVDRFTCVTYDVRGYGRSPPPTTAFKHCEDAAALIDELGLGRPVVVGHSIGALYALELAFLRPVAAVVSVCMSGLLPFPDERTQLFVRVRAAAREQGVDAAKAIWRASGWLEPARPEIDAMLADYTGWYWTHDSPSQNLEPPAVARLEQLAVPVVVVDGGKDLPYNHAVADELARRIPRATLVRLPDAGHMANLDDPAAVTRAILSVASPAG